MYEIRATGNEPVVKAPYGAPALIVHGTVADLTRGQGGPVPDVGLSGSSLVV